MLYWSGIQAGADLGMQGLALIALHAIETHLDQFVSLQAAIDLGDDTLAEAILADADYGMQAMGACAKRPALG